MATFRDVVTGQVVTAVDADHLAYLEEWARWVRVPEDELIPEPDPEPEPEPEPEPVDPEPEGEPESAEATRAPRRRAAKAAE